MGGTWRTLLPSAWSLGRAGSPLLSLQLLQQQTCRKGVPGTLPTAAGLLPLVVAGRLRAPVDVRRFRACGEQRAPAGQRIAFDTLKLVRVFEASEFTPKQAEALSSALSQIIADALAYNTEVVATKAEFSALKSEMQILEKADFAVLRSDLQLVEKKVETFMAQIYTELERIENRVIKWVIGAAGTAVMLILGIMRALGGGGGGGGRGLNGSTKSSLSLSTERGLLVHQAGPVVPGSASAAIPAERPPSSQATSVLNSKSE